MVKRTVPVGVDNSGETEMLALAELDFQPLMTESQVFESEAEYNETWGVKRRIMLMMLTRCRADMLDAYAKAGGGGADLYLEMIDHVREYRDHLRAGIELAETSMARLAGIAMAVGADPGGADGQH